MTARPSRLKFPIACAVALSTCAHSAFAQQLSFLQLPPQSAPRDLLYNPLSNKLYSANTPQTGAISSESVTIIDGSSDTVIANLIVAAGSRDFCLNTQDNRVYVANYFADCVTVIDGVTNAVLAVVPAGDGPRALCYNSQDNRIYCANEFSGSLTVIDGSTSAVLTTVPVGSTPRVLCYNPTSNKVYCPNAGSQTLSIVRGDTNAVIATVPVGAVPRGILFNPQNNRVYCSNYGSDTVSVIDGVTNAVVATIPVGDGPTALGFNPLGNKVYVSNVGAPGPNTPAACSVSVIGGSTNTVLQVLPAGDEPTAFCFGVFDGNMYWANEWSHSVGVVDAATDTPEQVVSLGSPPVQPVDMACNSSNGRVYTANRLTNQIGVLSPATSVSYCTAGTTTNGCNAVLSASGWPSASATSGFTLTATNVEGLRTGLIFYGTSGRNAAFWAPGSSSVLCVKSPAQRTTTALTGGNNNSCSGTLSLDWLAWLATRPGALGQPLASGRVFQAQCWFRDPAAPGGTHLSQGLEWTLAP